MGYCMHTSPLAGNIFWGCVSVGSLIRCSESNREEDWIDGIWTGAVWRQAPGKRGAFLHERLVAVGQRGVSVRSVGGNRAGEMRITRLLRNSRVSAGEVFAQAAAGTAGRVAGLHVLAIQDTTSLRDDGAGHGLVAHPTIAVEAETGALLGLAHGEILSRSGGLAESRRERAIEEKQSQRWLDGAEAGARLAAAGAALVTVVADREGDIYEMFALKPAGVELLVRAGQDRALADDAGLLFSALAGQAEAGRFTVKLPAAPGRKAREARIAVRFRPVTLKRPARHPAASDLPGETQVFLVEAREIDPPAGVKPAHWRLLTTHRIESFEAARWLTGLYRMRWVIEQLFRTIKTKGFDIERVSMAEAPFEKLCAAVLVAGVSCLQLVQDRDGLAGRPLDDVFESEDRPALEAVSAQLEGKTEKQKNPHPKGSLAFAAWVCARLGGWTGYYGKPGPVVMLRGLYQFRAIQQGWSLARNV